MRQHGPRWLLHADSTGWHDSLAGRVADSLAGRVADSLAGRHAAFGGGTGGPAAGI
jgi:hypothetical protein